MAGGEDEGLSMGDLSLRTGCPIETIRYYERIGIMRDPPRTAGRHRVYGGADVRQLTIICRARSLGFSLEQVRALLVMAERPEASQAEVRALTASHLHEVRSKISRLRDVENRLDALVRDCPEGGGPECPIINWLNSGDQPSPAT